MLLPAEFFAACPVLECFAELDWFFLYNVFLSLSVVQFLYHLEYRVVGVDVCVVHLQSVLTHLIYMILLQCVHMFPFPRYFQNFHGISHTPICCYIYRSVCDVSIYCWLCFLYRKLLWVAFFNILVICLTSFPQYVNMALLFFDFLTLKLYHIIFISNMNHLSAFCAPFVRLLHMNMIKENWQQSANEHYDVILIISITLLTITYFTSSTCIIGFKKQSYYYWYWKWNEKKNTSA
jgi:hypothetical protein